MAQRLIHLLLSEMMIKTGGGEYIKAPERFIFGSLLPDAYRKEDQDGIARRDASILTHFKSATADMEYRYFDFAEFYSRFKELILTDDMYLGYYIHLVEDSYYRYYTHVKRGIPRVASPEQVTFMHRDYHLLNAYIACKYSVYVVSGARGAITIPADFAQERINGLYQFDAEKMLNELSEDFSDKPDGKTVILTEELLDGFIEGYAEKCAEVIRSIKEGRSLPEPLDLKWHAGKNKEYL